MMITGGVRERSPGSAVPAGAADVAEEKATSAEEARLPFPGYDRLSERELRQALCGHSQIELEAAEGYERSHEHREAVLNKLRYLRGCEPLPGYDALAAEEILTALEAADLQTIKKVRAYERKFRGRPRVLDEVGRIQRARRAAEPARVVPAYRPASARLGASARGTETGRREGEAGMTDPAETGLRNGLGPEITRSLVSLWTRYAGKPPATARTEIRGNVVTCVLVDAVGDYNLSMAAAHTRDTVAGIGKLTPATYKQEAVAAVVRVTRQRVTSFISSHDRDTDVATEVFTLEPSLGRGRAGPRRAAKRQRTSGDSQRRSSERRTDRDERREPDSPQSRPRPARARGRGPLRPRAL
jgi:hypothetical protein